jgi:hypothetical protein
VSAWIVHRHQLDLLLTAAIAWQIVDADSADNTGRTLWAENLASVAYLYPHSRDGVRPGPDDFRDHDVTAYTFRSYPGRVDPDVVLSAAESLTCQSSQHPGWASSAARTWVDRLAAEADRRSPAYATEHGTVDRHSPPARAQGWYEVFTGDGRPELRCTDGWAVRDRDVFIHATAARTGRAAP